MPKTVPLKSKPAKRSAPDSPADDGAVSGKPHKRRDKRFSREYVFPLETAEWEKGLETDVALNNTMSGRASISVMTWVSADIQSPEILADRVSEFLLDPCFARKLSWFVVGAELVLIVYTGQCRDKSKHYGEGQRAFASKCATYSSAGFKNVASHLSSLLGIGVHPNVYKRGQENTKSPWTPACRSLFIRDVSPLAGLSAGHLHPPAAAGTTLHAPAAAGTTPHAPAAGTTKQAPASDDRGASTVMRVVRRGNSRAARDKVRATLCFLACPLLQPYSLIICAGGFLR